MSLPQIVSRDEWVAARKEFLAREKELTRARDALNADRRRLPMVRVEEEYVFEGSAGKASLLDLFEGRRQLIVHHFMFDPRWDGPCPGCASTADNIGNLAHLNGRETTLVAVSRAPLAKLEAFRARMGWTFPWYSSADSDFNYDYHVTLDDSVTPVVYNFRTRAEHQEAGTAAMYVDGEQPFELPGLSCFLRDGDTVYHTYSTYARGLEAPDG
ncbi:MAG TPA: DUF899 domain-containing protein, partial [Actinopolymorphaceae bacterium]|nr:DUF899 domain-containing protein [Actinopolymorphaceae bacterium]